VALAVLLGALGCAAVPPPVEPPTGPTGARERSGGVVVEPAPALPPVVAGGDARGVIALRPAPDDREIAAVVERLLEAWKHASLEELSALLAADAGPIGARARGRAALAESWRTRLQAHPYARLAGAELARPERIARWDPDRADGGAPPPPGSDLRAGEIYVRVPLEVTRLGGERVFGDAITLALRSEGGRLTIAAYGEEGAP
jgi:hypothetical protein